MDALQLAMSAHRSVKLSERVLLIRELKAENDELKQQLREYKQRSLPPTPGPRLVDLIKQVICKEFNLREQDLMSRRLYQKVVFPRQIAMHLALSLGMSRSATGREMGGYDHSTALHAYNKISAVRMTDTLFDARMSVLERELQAAVTP